MAKATSIIANRGVMIKPRLFKGSREFNSSEFSYSEPVTQGKLNIQQEWFDFVIDAMVEVNKSGTASQYLETLPFPLPEKREQLRFLQSSKTKNMILKKSPRG